MDVYGGFGGPVGEGVASFAHSFPVQSSYVTVGLLMGRQVIYKCFCCLERVTDQGYFYIQFISK